MLKTTAVQEEEEELPELSQLCLPPKSVLLKCPDPSPLFADAVHDSVIGRFRPLGGPQRGAAGAGPAGFVGFVRKPFSSITASLFVAHLTLSNIAQFSEFEIMAVHEEELPGLDQLLSFSVFSQNVLFQRVMSFCCADAVHGSTVLRIREHGGPRGGTAGTG